MIRIVYDDEQRPEDGLVKIFDRAAELVAGREGMGAIGYEVSLFFSDEDEMRELNAKYRGVDRPTDVLSFPMLEPEQDGCGTGEGGQAAAAVGSAPVMLGDVVICLDVAKSQAKEYGHGEERELAFLFTHGLLHILGYDHEGGEAEKMRLAEEEIMTALGLAV